MAVTLGLGMRMRSLVRRRRRHAGRDKDRDRDPSSVVIARHRQPVKHAVKQAGRFRAWLTSRHHSCGTRALPSLTAAQAAALRKREPRPSHEVFFPVVEDSSRDVDLSTLPRGTRPRAAQIILASINRDGGGGGLRVAHTNGRVAMRSGTPAASNTCYIHAI